MNRKLLPLYAFLTALLPLDISADTIPESSSVDWLPTISGTLRVKGEYQTEEGEGRFEVRNARIALDGNVTPRILYRAEVDLSDEGRIRMLDAYAGIQPMEGLLFRLGQMRVPFTIDAHRSPHKQYFANRSFIAKQVGDVRDVGLSVAYQFPNLPLTVEGGAFNGSGLTNQKDYWTKEFNFSAKLQYQLVQGLTLQASIQKVSPNNHNVYLYDGAVSWNRYGWLLEAEYLHKCYAHNDFSAVNAWNVMSGYEWPLHPKHALGKQMDFQALRVLMRYDRMDDHSDGSVDENNVLQLTDAERQRLTGGITLCFGRKTKAELRLNYEKYFYKNKELAKPSERDKAVMEIMVRF